MFLEMNFFWKCSIPFVGALVSLFMKITNALNEVSSVQHTRDEHRTLSTIPFQSEYKFMVTLHESKDPSTGTPSLVAFLKGAPDRLLARCSLQAVGNNPWISEPVNRSAWEASVADLSSQGLRVLALCRRILPPAQFAITSDCKSL